MSSSYISTTNVDRPYHPAPKCGVRMPTTDSLDWRSVHLQHQILPNGATTRSVVAVKELSSNNSTAALRENTLLSGDILEEIKVGDVSLVAPFVGGKTTVQREFRRLHNKGRTIIEAKVRRGHGKIALVPACILANDSTTLKKQYVLGTIDESQHIVTLIDSTEEECLALREMTCARLATHLANAQLKRTYVPYSLEDKLPHFLPTTQTSKVFSLLVVPFAAGDMLPLSSGVDDIVERALTWFYAAQSSGIPIAFLNIQTEPLLTKVRSQQGSSRSVSQEDLSSIINTSIYSFEDYHGIDIGIMRAVRLWYGPTFAEIAVVLKWEKDETRLGVGVSLTDEGFCYVNFVDDDTPAHRAGLKTLYQEACATGNRLVITRLGEQYITPSMVSSSGYIRCFDTTSIKKKLSLHRLGGYPVRLHLILWDEAILETAYRTAAEEPVQNAETTRTAAYHAYYNSVRQGQMHTERQHWLDSFESSSSYSSQKQSIRSKIDYNSNCSESTETEFSFRVCQN